MVGAVAHVGLISQQSYLIARKYRSNWDNDNCTGSHRSLQATACSLSVFGMVFRLIEQKCVVYLEICFRISPSCCIPTTSTTLALGEHSSPLRNARMKRGKEENDRARLLKQKMIAPNDLTKKKSKQKP